MSKASSTRFLIVAVAFLAHTACSDDSSSGDDDGGNGGTSGSAGTSGSSSGGTSGTSSLPDPCELVTYDQLEAITGEELVRTEILTGTVSGDPSCTWFAAADYPVFQVGLWSSLSSYEFSADMADSSPLSGIGEEAHLGDFNTVNVKLTTNGFFAQSLVPVADGQISPEIQAAASTEMQSSIEEYEAAFRGAKLVVDAL